MRSPWATLSIVLFTMVASAACRGGAPPTTTTPPPEDTATPDDSGGGDDGGDEGGGDDSAEPVVYEDLVINELMAGNRFAVADPLGGSADWLEIFNPGDEDVDLDGWGLLIDGADDPYLLEDLTVGAGAQVVIWADDASGLGPDHTDFTLELAGGELSLLAPDETVKDTVSWPSQATDIAAARTPDGAAHWSLTTSPTPGTANAEGDGREGGTSDGTCALAADLDDPYFWEGETIDFSVDCTGDLSMDEVELEVVVAPDSATLADQDFTMESGPSDGGRVDVIFSARPADALDQIPEAATTTFWVADNPDLADAIDPVPTEYTEEWGLPVIHIETGVDFSQTYVDATITHMGTAYDAEVKVRGASSVSYPKQSYTLDFDDEELNIEGWARREHIVLTSTFDDNSYVRQKLVFDMWQAMAEYWGALRLTPRTFFAVVYLEGAYHGLYVATDHVDEEFAVELGFDSGGNLYKSVSHDANFYNTDANGYAKSSWHAGYEKKEGDDLDDFDDLDEWVEWAASSDAETIVDEAGQRFSLTEFMDWFLLVHFTECQDSAGKNAYFYNVDEGAPAFRLTPWDFNAAFGQNWYTRRVDSDYLQTYEWHNRIFWAIANVESADAERWERYAAMRTDGPLSPEWLKSTVDAYYDDIHPSAERDWAKWGGQYYSFSRWASTRNSDGDWTDYEGERAYLDTWIDERITLFDADHPLE